MLIFPGIQFKRFHQLWAGLLSVSGVLLSTPALGLELSELQGVSQIGRPIQLSSSVSNIPAGAESQLRSTCLKARIYSLEDLSVGSFNKTSTELFVNFDPTVKRGGLMEFRSAREVNEALIELELVSECPLVVFQKRWTLIMAQSGDPEGVPEAKPQSTSTTRPVFDLDGSSLLAASRRPPLREIKSVSTWAAVAPSPNSVAGQQDAQGRQGDSSVELAAVNPQLQGIRPTGRANPLPMGVQVNPPTDTGLASLFLPNDLLNNPYLPAVATVLLMLGLGVVVLRKRKLQRIHSGDMNESADPDFSQQTEEGDQDRDQAQEDRLHFFTDESKPAGGHRLLESLIGSEASTFDNHGDGLLNPSQSNLEGVEKLALKASLDLINRSHIKNWILPGAYMPLVENRNKSLELHRTMDALLLRCQLGLVELAFQDAKIGNVTSAEVTAELMDVILGERVHDTELIPILFVPDLIKSHVRAKLCEIVGTEKRQLLKENLVNLNIQVTSPALCFSSNCWREFLSEEGILE